MPSHQPTIINNQYAYFTWQHVSKKKYRIINTSLPSLGITLRASVYRVDENGDQAIIENVLIPNTAPNNSVEVDLTYKPETDFAGDGVYRYCITPIRSVVNTAPVNILGLRIGRTIVIMPPTTTSDNISLISIGGLVIYDPLVNGAANFTNPPTSLANATNAINDYLNTFVGSGSPTHNVRWIAPNASTGYVDDIPVNAWRLVVETYAPNIDPAATTALLGLQVQLNGTTSVGSVHQCVLYFPDVEAPAGFDYISSAVVNNVNVLANPIPISSTAALFQAITDYLDTLGQVAFYDVSNTNQPTWIVSPCSTLTSITFAQIEEEILPTVCYLELELQDTYTCYTARLRQKLCKDPCCTNCNNKEDIENEKIIEEISLLMDGAILRMSEIVRLYQWQGSIWVTDQNAIHTTRIVNYFAYLRKLVFNCGYGCKEVKPCGC